MDASHEVIASTNGDRTADRALTLSLHITDPEVVSELNRHAEGLEREQYAACALRLGVLALRQASGSIDADRIRSEGERLVADVRTLLVGHTGTLSEKLNGAIAQYFDPQTGDLTQRLDRLVRKDGDLEAVLARHLDGEASSLARTLAGYVGENSPVSKQLSPTEHDGFLATLQRAIEETLQGQRNQVLRQFSLDDKDSALSRLVVEITDTNGKLREKLAADIDVVRKEFSLDQPDGALSRLVNRVDETTKQVRSSLTLDDDASPLAVLRRELLAVIENLNDTNAAFHTEVRSTLEALRVRRAEAARSTRHGLEFEDAVGEQLAAQIRNSGDLLEVVAQITGKIARCKVGDFVLTLGPESAGRDGRIVFEAKESKSYDLRAALEELAIARENRDAQVAVAVLSRAIAPEGMEPLVRFGSDIVVIWDRDDATSDVLLMAALSLARALVVRERSEQDRVQAEFTAIEDAVRRITKGAESLSEIMTLSETVRSNGMKIHDKAEKLSDELDKQLEVLRRNVEGLKDTTGQEVAAA